MRANLKAIFENRNHKGLQRYANNLSWMLMARITTMFVSFLATTYIARALQPTNYGELSYAISFVAIINIFATLGIDQALGRELLFFSEKRNTIMGTALVLRLCASVTTVFIGCVFAYLTSAHDVSLYAIFIISISLILQSLTLLGQEFQAAADSKWVSIQSVAITIILNCAKIIVVYLNGGVLWLAGILVLESILYAIGFTILRTRHFGNLSQLSFDRQVARNIFRSAIPLTFVSGFYMIYARIDQVFIKHMIDARSVGLYDAAVRLSEAWYFIPHILITGLAPAIANAKKINAAQYNIRVRRLFSVLITATIILALSTTALSGPVVLLVFGASFAPTAPILAIYIWSNIGAALTHLVQQVLLIEDMPNYILIGTFLGMATNVALCTLLIPTYGVLGAAIASLIAYIMPFCTIFIFTTTRKLAVDIYKNNIVMDQAIIQSMTND